MKNCNQIQSGPGLLMGIEFLAMHHNYSLLVSDPYIIMHILKLIAFLVHPGSPVSQQPK